MALRFVHFIIWGFADRFTRTNIWSHQHNQPPWITDTFFIKSFPLDFLQNANICWNELLTTFIHQSSEQMILHIASNIILFDSRFSFTLQCLRFLSTSLPLFLSCWKIFYFSVGWMCIASICIRFFQSFCHFFLCSCPLPFSLVSFK